MQNSPSPGYSHPLSVPRFKHPRELIVFGVLHLTLIGVALVSCIAVSVYPEAMGDNPLQAYLDKDPWFAAHHRVSTALGYETLAVLGISAVGLLKSKEWARKTTIYWAVFCMAWSGYDAWVHYQHVTGPLLAQIMADTAEASSAASLTAIMQTPMALSTLLGLVLTLPTAPSSSSCSAAPKS